MTNLAESIQINYGICTTCGACVKACPNNIIQRDADAAILARHLRSRRSIRLWKDSTVTNEECEELIKITAHAPSGCNLHQVKWVVVNDPAKVKAFVAASAELLRQIPKDNRMYGLAAGLLRKLNVGNDILCRNAPALLIAVANPKEDLGLVDSIISLTYADVYATSIGLGTCWGPDL